MTDKRPDREEEGRLRKIFSSLPRVGAPADFEGRVRRTIASRTAGDPRARRRFTAYAVPALSLIVVGVLTIVIYQARFTGDPVIPEPPQIGPTKKSPVAVPGTSEPAGREAGRSPATLRPEAGGGSDVSMKRSDAKGGGTREPDSKKPDGIPPSRSKTIPGINKSKEEVADPTPTAAPPAARSIMNSVVPPDSVGARFTAEDSTGIDSTTTDSISTSADTLRRAVDTTSGPADTANGHLVPPHR